MNDAMVLGAGGVFQQWENKEMGTKVIWASALKPDALGCGQRGKEGVLHRAQVRTLALSDRERE